jgi:hypothetical protein
MAAWVVRGKSSAGGATTSGTTGDDLNTELAKKLRSEEAAKRWFK